MIICITTPISRMGPQVDYIQNIFIARGVAEHTLVPIMGGKQLAGAS